MGSIGKSRTSKSKGKVQKSKVKSPKPEFPPESDAWGGQPCGRRGQSSLDTGMEIGYDVGVGAGWDRLPAGAHFRVTE
jgi:hypothetical protein